jgi:hypothetical protein
MILYGFLPTILHFGLYLLKGNASSLAILFVLPGPDSVAFESRRDLDDVLFSDPDLDLAGVVHHLHGVSVGRLVAGLSHCTQSRAQPSPSLVDESCSLIGGKGRIYTISLIG